MKHTCSPKCRNAGHKNAPTQLTITITPAHMTELNAMEAYLGVNSHRELLNVAFTLLDWAVERRRQGYTIASVNESKNVYRVLSMPHLDAITPRAELEETGLVD